MMSVDSWWYFLCAIGTFNLVMWSFAARQLGRRRAVLTPDAYAMRQVLMLLSAVYALGCAYRCFFLVYDVPRICLFDSVLASVAVGRSVATIAELSFVAQWALILRESSRATGSMVGKVVSLALVPLIVIAETFSWFAVLTTSNVGHVVEESIWGVSVALLIGSVVVILPRSGRARPLLAAWCLAGVAYVAFMFTVDVPMYWSRWLADEAAGRQYMTVAQGLFDISHRRVVSHIWADWKNEVAWMSLYFSVAVWISIALMHTPAPKSRLAAGREPLVPTVKLGTF